MAKQLVHVYIEPEHLEIFKSKKAISGVPISELIRRAIVQYLVKEGDLKGGEMESSAEKAK